ncbi:hypothetical protein DQ239_13640 [Blastococcus sp. TF02-09]|uniref:hypothetical protein n=1 Tax=Blastococcus sp. TF02-09 TaxID=2250576 RepID=UPI000DEA6A57|nr:hypothetical protein [Blastococcus sp. TF02-9]RBY76582.1 hypothetical protein DQ239_13640 [Blastococcus sp. TF02-9]
MTGPEGPAAAEVFVAGFEPRPGGRVRHGVRILGAFVSSLAQGLLPPPAVHDVVVRRRDDGTEVSRIPVENPDVPAETLRFVQQDLASRSAGQFVAEWRPRA